VGFYQSRIVPHLVQLAMRQATLVPYRRRVIAGAKGRVLEIGFGSGLNLPFYGPGVSGVVGLEPSAKLLSMARPSVDAASGRTELLKSSADAIPLDDRSIDTAVTTWTLCTIPDVLRALAEVRRVLKPDGRLVFVEHGRSPDAGVRRWQDRLNPLWKPIAGGCHLNRPIADLIARSGFEMERLETGYGEGPKVTAFMYEGVARPV
jgi:ubiquinone/menaquinone biosynthesis C-methylase UbiE